MYSEISSLVQVTDADQIYHPIDLQLFLFWLAVDCYDEVVRMARKHKHVRIRHEFAGVENWNQQVSFFLFLEIIQYQFHKKVGRSLPTLIY